MATKPNRVATTAQRPARRCGLPSEDSYQRDGPLLFIQNMHREFSDQEITSFFVRRSVYLAFFGPSLVLYRETGDGPDGPPQPPRKRKREQEHSAETENGAIQSYATSSHPVTIVFKAFEDGRLKTKRRVTVDPQLELMTAALAKIP
ncbi:uncharacterized protein B0T15DRAFT_576184 [Chaetomium strumarium]|uniref:Uncharacterized protein n=1 Tax=Chaetomium strumarium TaxID=1170767 RepID=A0AAJ0M0U6_9PEZI|nr:hypothetical protein B0T15DRAFT_576184 [Chaetomium strumarium]